MTQLAVLRQEVGRLTTRIDAAYLDKLDGIISEDAWLRVSRGWEDDRARLEQRVTSLESGGPASFIPTVREALELAKVAADAYKLATPSERRELVDSVCSNLLLTGKKLGFTMKKPFGGLAEGLRSADWLRD